MKYEEMSFRAVYHDFCVLPMIERIKKLITNFPTTDDANGVLTYGYYDREAGLTLEVIATVVVQDEEIIEYNETSLDTRCFIRMESVADEDILLYSDLNGKLAEKYAEKIKTLHIYDPSEEVERVRKLMILDGCRSDFYVDDVIVRLIKEGNELEECWVRTNKLENKLFTGTLLNEPDQDFGYHKGDEIQFFVREIEEDWFVCVSDPIIIELLEEGLL